MPSSDAVSTTSGDQVVQEKEQEHAETPNGNLDEDLPVTSEEKQESGCESGQAIEPDAGASTISEGDAEAQQVKEETTYLTGFQLFAILSSVATAGFLITLDTSTFLSRWV